MKENDFIKLYRNNRGLKNQKEAKEKIDAFWNTLFKAVETGEKVIFKGWGKFEKKDIKSRKIKIPKKDQLICTQPKSIIKFRAGKVFRKRLVGAYE